MSNRSPAVHPAEIRQNWICHCRANTPRVQSPPVHTLQSGSNWPMAAGNTAGRNAASACLEQLFGFPELCGQFAVRLLARWALARCDLAVWTDQMKTQQLVKQSLTVWLRRTLHEGNEDWLKPNMEALILHRFSRRSHFSVCRLCSSEYFRSVCVHWSGLCPWCEFCWNHKIDPPSSSAETFIWGRLRSIETHRRISPSFTQAQNNNMLDY